jgi:hypothetical protein
VSSVVLQQALADLNVACRNLCASITGERKGRKVAPPRFRSGKDNRQAIRFTANARFKVLDNGWLRLPKAGDLEVRWSRSLPAAPSSVTVIRDAAGGVACAEVCLPGWGCRLSTRRRRVSWCGCHGEGASRPVSPAAVAP